MSADLLMPKLGLNMTEGMVASWAVTPGAYVSHGDILFTVETDKITTEIEAVGDGEIVEIIVPAGQTVAVGTAVARWTGGTVGDVSSEEGARAREPVTVAPSPESLVAATGRTGDRILATPYARRRARELGVALETVDGSGPRGRIKTVDVEKVAETKLAPEPLEPIAEAPASQQTGTATKAVLETTAEPFYWISAFANAKAVFSLLETLDPDRMRGVDISTIAAAAAACVHGGAMVLIENGQTLLFPTTHSLRFSDIAAGVDAERRPPTPEDPAAAVRTMHSAGICGSAPVANAVFTLTVGGLTDLFRPDSNGTPNPRCRVGLTLSAYPSELTEEDADALLNQIKEMIETPALLLLGRSP